MASLNCLKRRYARKIRHVFDTYLGKLEWFEWLRALFWLLLSELLDPSNIDVRAAHRATHSLAVLLRVLLQLVEAGLMHHVQWVASELENF